MNREFDAAMARIVKAERPGDWSGPDIETVVQTARKLQLDRRMLCTRLGLKRNAPWSDVIVRLEKFLPCRECGLPNQSHKFSCVTGAEARAARMRGEE